MTDRLIVGDQVHTYHHHGPGRLVQLDAEGNQVGAPIEVRSSTLVTTKPYNPADDEPIELFAGPVVVGTGLAKLTEAGRALLLGDPPLDKIARRR